MNNYYEINADRYINDTKDCDMNIQYQFFLKHLKKEDGKILDVGFGSGRDMDYFYSLGYEVEGVDPTKAFIDLLKDKYKVYNIKAEDINFVNEYDGIWACASLLHVKRDNLKEVLIRLKSALKKDGIIYISFKYGDYEGIYKDRYFNFLNENILKNILKDTNLSIVDILITKDVRKNREDERWLNVILK